MFFFFGGFKFKSTKKEQRIKKDFQREEANLDNHDITTLPGIVPGIAT